MASKFHLQVITPTKTFFDDEVEMAVVRTIEGDIGILRNHTPLVTPLSVGILKLKNEGSFREAAIAGGFVYVEKAKTVIMTDAAEWPEDIDVNRAQRAKERAEERIKNCGGEIDTIRAEIALNKALNRINVAEKK